MIRSTLILLLLLAGVIFCCGQQVGIQPATLDFHLSPGRTEAQVVKITNLSSQKMVFQLSLADWLRDSTGAHQYFRADTLPHSCASWVKLEKNSIEILPGRSEDILIRLQGPSDAQAFQQMKWAMLFLQSAPEQDNTAHKNKETETKIQQLLRVGIHIYQTPPSVTNSGAARAVALREAPDEKNAYDFSMINTGGTMLQCKVHLELTSIETGREIRSDIIEFPVFPEGKRVIRLKIPAATSSGKYSALAVLDIGEESSLEAIEKNIEVK